jgi:hypothetical protein
MVDQVVHEGADLAGDVSAVRINRVYGAIVRFIRLEQADEPAGCDVLLHRGQETKTDAMAGQRQIAHRPGAIDPNPRAHGDGSTLTSTMKSQWFVGLIAEFTMHACPVNASGATGAPAPAR